MNGKIKGYRTCFNCLKLDNCKLLKIAGIGPDDMANKCPDIKFKNKHSK